MYWGCAPRPRNGLKEGTKETEEKSIGRKEEKRDRRGDGICSFPDEILDTPVTMK